MKPESLVQIKQRLAIAELGGKAYRNNSGVLPNPDGDLVRFGLGNDSKKINILRKSSDLICVLPVVVTQAMVGHTLGVILVDEVKKEGWRYTGTREEVAQKNFIDIIISMGGIGCFAQSVLDLKMAVKAFYARFI